MILHPLTLLAPLLASALAAPATTDADVAALVRAALLGDARQQAFSPAGLGRAAERRPDFALAREVRALLAARLPGLGALAVTCTGGEVVLRGKAADAATAARAAELAASLPGVRSVTSLLGAPDAAPARPPATEAAAVALGEPFAYLTWDGLAAREVGVHVADGLVTLTGLASSARSRDYATACSRLVPGARSVRNEMVVRPGSREEDERLAKLIHRHLEWTLELQPYAHQLGVSVQDGVVTLEGELPGEAERLLAVEVATSTRGVLVVDDRLELVPAGRIPPPPRRPLRYFVPRPLGVT